MSPDIPFFFYGLSPLIFESLTSGQYATYETISSWSFLYAAGLGNVEYGITVSLILLLDSLAFINLI